MLIHVQCPRLLCVGAMIPMASQLCLPWVACRRSVQDFGILVPLQTRLSGVGGLMWVEIMAKPAFQNLCSWEKSAEKPSWRLWPSLGLRQC
mmetsp:Transcript_7071/g.15097  ORF Transcript_7071/g.15097 Transcript_7071/m.15097 type:complete len:91 (-) Transcript_7071:403-675(-)